MNNNSEKQPKTPERRDSLLKLVCPICKHQEHCTGNSDFECIEVHNFFCLSLVYYYMEAYKYDS